MNYARMDGDMAVEVFTPPAGFPIAECFHPEVAVMFTEVPDNVTVGSTIDAQGNWTAPVPVPAPAPRLPVMSPTAFYLAFTPTERIAIKASADPMVMEFWATFNIALQNDKPIDPNLVSVTNSLAYLAQPTTAQPPGAGILASADRIPQILNGVPQ